MTWRTSTACLTLIALAACQSHHPAPRDQAVTRVIRLRYLAVERIADRLASFVHPDAALFIDRAENAIVITDEAGRVRDLVQAIDEIDHGRGASFISYRHLDNTGAVEAARLVNKEFRGINAEAPAVRPHPLLPAVQSRLYADGDARTNTVILDGPPEFIALAMKMLDEMEVSQGESP